MPSLLPTHADGPLQLLRQPLADAQPRPPQPRASDEALQRFTRGIRRAVAPVRWVYGIGDVQIHGAQGLRSGNNALLAFQPSLIVANHISSRDSLVASIGWLSLGFLQTRIGVPWRPMLRYFNRAATSPGERLADLLAGGQIEHLSKPAARERSGSAAAVRRRDANTKVLNDAKGRAASNADLMFFTPEGGRPTDGTLRRPFSRGLAVLAERVPVWLLGISYDDFVQPQRWLGPVHDSFLRVSGPYTVREGAKPEALASEVARLLCRANTVTASQIIGAYLMVRRDCAGSDAPGVQRKELEGVVKAAACTAASLEVSVDINLLNAVGRKRALSCLWQNLQRRNYLNARGHITSRLGAAATLGHGGGIDDTSERHQELPDGQQGLTFWARRLQQHQALEPQLGAQLAHIFVQASQGLPLPNFSPEVSAPPVENCTVQ